MCKDGKAAWDHWNRIFDGRRTSIRDRQPYSVGYDAVNAMSLNEFLKEHRKVQELEANAAQQQKQIEALTAGLQKVSARLEASKLTPQVADSNY
jgi:hypothetical protein